MSINAGLKGVMSALLCKSRHLYEIREQMRNRSFNYKAPPKICNRPEVPTWMQNRTQRECPPNAPMATHFKWTCARSSNIQQHRHGFYMNSSPSWSMAMAI